MQIGITGMLFMLFLTLKLCDVIDWSWWWVTAPVWGVFALATLFVVPVAIIKELSKK